MADARGLLQCSPGIPAVPEMCRVHKMLVTGFLQEI